MIKYADFLKEFDTVPVYTRKQYNEAIEKCIKENIVNRVILQGKDYNVPLQIVIIHSTPEGLTVIVK